MLVDDDFKGKDAFKPDPDAALRQRVANLNALDSTQLISLFDRPGLELHLRMKMPGAQPPAINLMLNLMFEAFVQGIVMAQKIINTGGETKQ